MVRKLELREKGPASVGTRDDEIVIGVSPAFNIDVFQTLSKINIADALYEIMAGVEEEGINVRLIRVFRTSDLAFIGHDAAKLSGSGISVGLQSKGTTVIHQRDLYPLSNLELFSMASFLTLEHYRMIGINAARYAKKMDPMPIVTPWSDDAHIVKARTLSLAALIVQIEERRTANKPPVELEYNFS